LGASDQRRTPAGLPQGQRPIPHVTGSWLGPKVDLDGSGKSRTHPDSIPGLTSP